jgi:sulfhydrogenase subunit beta (sulfur reductase)
MPIQAGQSAVLERNDFDAFLLAVTARGYQLIGPTIRDEAIVYGPVDSANDLPAGWTDEQDGGKYRLKRRTDNALFGYAVGPHSWKRYLHPPVQRLWRAQREGNGFRIVAEEQAPPRYAFLGVRSCELHAIAIQDKVFLGGAYADPIYKSRHEDLFLVAVNCAQAGGTCFCASMATGPKATAGYDLALTEILQNGRHYFVAEVGTQAGAEVLSDIPHQTAEEADLHAARRVVEETARHMGRTMDTVGIKELLYRNYDHPQWDNVAKRCLSCANCTMVCPTCFCSTVEDVTDLSGENAERVRKWDSCFTMDFSYLHGGSVRATTKSRYRQWMTHKLATWIDQFGSSGCVGCGRCITWCPVAIDLTAEVRAIRESESLSADQQPGENHHDRKS